MKQEHWFKRVMYLSVISCALIGSVVGAINYFAKSSTVNLLDKRLELAIEDDNVNRAQGDVDWIQHRIIFERRSKPPTITETEAKERAEQKLADAKKIRTQKQKSYEQAK